MKQFLNTAKNFIIKHSPLILSIAGGTSIAIGTVVACRKTVGIEKLNRETKSSIDSARETGDKKKLTKAYFKAVRSYGKRYYLPTILVGGGISAMAASSCILNNRVNAVSTAYAAAVTAFSAYRERIKGAIGEEAENKLFFNSDEQVKTVDTDEVDESGNPVKKQVKVNIPKENVEEFCRLFGDGYNPYWSKDNRANVLHLQACEANANARLRERGKNGKIGKLSMNEFWNILGFTDCYTDEGQYLGWIYKEGDPVYGGTKIDFGFTENDKNKDKIDEMKHLWNHEMWISVTPPHCLIGNLDKEKRRTKDEKNDIISNRKGLV